MTRSYKVYLARWTKRLSWKENAAVFETSWDTVFRAVRFVVDYGLDHRTLDDITEIGVDEVAVFMLGFDKQFESGFQLGGAWSPQSNDALYLQSILGIGVTDCKTDRNIPFLGRTATSDHDAIYDSAFLGGGYKQQIDNWILEPRAGFKYINLNEDSFTEHGAEAASLAINSKDSEALVSSLGFVISHSCDLSNGLLMPSFRADWFHNFSAKGENTLATLQSGETFSVEGREASKDSLELAGGLTMLVSAKLHGTLEYQYTFADNQNRAHLLSAGLSYCF